MVEALEEKTQGTNESFLDYFVYDERFDEEDEGNARDRVLEEESDEKELFYLMNLSKYYGSTSDSQDREFWKNAAKDIRMRIAEKRKGMIDFLARKVKVPGVQYDERISLGNLELMNAIDSFDFTTEERFAMFASTAIIRAFGRLAGNIQSEPVVQKILERQPYTPHLVNSDYGRVTERQYVTLSLVEGIPPAQVCNEIKQLFGHSRSPDEVIEDLVSWKFYWDGKRATPRNL